MGKKDQLTSTERLLRVIREGAGGDPSPAAQGSVVDRSGQEQKPTSTGKSRVKFSLGRKSTLGVDIGDDAIRLLALEGDGDHPRISNIWKLPLRISRDSPDFPGQLKKLLEDSIGPAKGMHLWSCLPSSQVEIIHLRIPRVAKKDIPGTVFWSLKRDKGFNEREQSFDFIVDGEVVDKGIPKLSVIAVTFPHDLGVKTKALFAGIGYPLQGLTAQPFAIQNLLARGWLSFNDQTISVLTIQDEGTRIDIFQQQRLVLSREVRTGLGSLVDGFTSQFQASRAQENFEGEEGPSFSESDSEYQLTATQSRLMLLGALGHPHGKVDLGTSREFAQKELFELTIPALQRLARQIERTFTYNTQTLGQEAVSLILVAGELAAGHRLREYLSEQLGVEVGVLDAFSQSSAAISTSPVPPEPEEKAAYTPVLGLALSDPKRTPNLLHTFKDKVSQQKAVFFQRVVLAVTFGCALVLGALFLWQTESLSSKRQELASVESRLAAFKPQVSEQLLFQLAGKIKNSHEELREYAKRYAGLAAMTEIIQLTPGTIKLVKVTADLGRGKGAGRQRSEGQRGGLILEGIVTGGDSGFETELAGYLIRLRSSAILDAPEVHSSSVEPYPGAGEVLHFMVYLNIV